MICGSAGSPEHHPHAVDDRVVDVRQRFEKEERHDPDDVVDPARVVASSLFDFDPPGSNKRIRGSGSKDDVLTP